MTKEEKLNTLKDKLYYVEDVIESAECFLDLVGVNNLIISKPLESFITNQKELANSIKAEIESVESDIF